MKLPTTNWTAVFITDAVPLSEAVVTINSKCPGAGYTETKLLEQAHNGQIVLFTRLVNVEATSLIRKFKAAEILAKEVEYMAAKSGIDSFGIDSFGATYYGVLEDVISPPPYSPKDHTEQWLKKISKDIPQLNFFDLRERIFALRNWVDQITLNGHVAIPPITSGEFLCEDVVKLEMVFSYDAGFTRNDDGTKGRMYGSESFWVNKKAKRESLRIDQRQINWIIEFLNRQVRTPDKQVTAADSKAKTNNVKPYEAYLRNLRNAIPEATAKEAKKRIKELLKNDDLETLMVFELRAGEPVLAGQTSPKSDATWDKWWSKTKGK